MSSILNKFKKSKLSLIKDIPDPLNKKKWRGKINDFIKEMKVIFIIYLIILKHIFSNNI